MGVILAIDYGQKRYGLALSDEKIKRTISGKQLTMKPIVVHSPGSKLVNIVVR